MEEIRLGAIESRFADMIWRSEPIHSRELVKLCEKELSWKKSTTYTVLRRLCEAGDLSEPGRHGHVPDFPRGVLRPAKRKVCR